MKCQKRTTDPHKRPRPEESDHELIPDNRKENSANSNSDSGSSEELMKDKRGQKPKSRARSIPRRLRGKQRDPRRRSEAASSSRDRPPLPTTESGNESDDSTVPYDSDHEDLVVFDDDKKLDFTNR